MTMGRTNGIVVLDGKMDGFNKTRALLKGNTVALGVLLQVSGGRGDRGAKRGTRTWP